jgi:predicted enzyme related to lactoylglutathione lyase
MPARTSYAQGTPNWVDLQSPDTTAAQAFYGALFGWSFEDMPMPDDGVYSMARIGDSEVAAIATQMPGTAGTPAVWSTYLAVDSADEAAAKVQAAGGQVVMGPFDVPGAGREAIVVDPSGATVSLWQAGGHIGATLVNEPGCILWNELITSDLSAATAFYEQVLGMTAAAMDMGDANYTVFQAGGAMVGGATEPAVPGLPNHWHAYFAVGDADASAAKISELGGEIVVPPFDIPVGRIAMARDPQGALFSIIKSAN